MLDVEHFTRTWIFNVVFGEGCEKTIAGFGIGRAWFILTGCTPVCINVNGLNSIINTFKLGEFVCLRISPAFTCPRISPAFSCSRISPAFSCSRIYPAFTCYLESTQWISTGDLYTAYCSSPIDQTNTFISVIFIFNFPPPCTLHQKEVVVTQNLMFDNQMFFSDINHGRRFYIRP